MIIEASFLGGTSKYDSFEDSVQAGSRINDEINNAGINGEIFAGYEFNGTELIIEAGNGVFLHVFATNKNASWRTSTSRPTIDQSIPMDGVFFKLPSGTEIPWNWKDTLDSFMGKQFAISASDRDLFIFYRGGIEYRISTLKSTSSNEVYLVLLET